MCHFHLHRGSHANDYISRPWDTSWSANSETLEGSQCSLTTIRPKLDFLKVNASQDNQTTLEVAKFGINYDHAHAHGCD